MANTCSDLRVALVLQHCNIDSSLPDTSRSKVVGRRERNRRLKMKRLKRLSQRKAIIILSCSVLFLNTITMRSPRSMWSLPRLVVYSLARRMPNWEGWGYVALTETNQHLSNL